VKGDLLFVIWLLTRFVTSNAGLLRHLLQVQVTVGAVSAC
jgi:hypothetical protein